MHGLSPSAWPTSSLDAMIATDNLSLEVLDYAAKNRAFSRLS
ncbi:TPA: hypothetical protein ACVGJZ_006590 [Pseudomonas aeruginosa]